MKGSSKKDSWVAVVLTAVLCTAAVAPAGAKGSDEEIDLGPQLADELAARLGELDRWADRLAKVEEGESVAYGVEEVSALIDWLGSQIPKIEKCFESRRDTTGVDKSGELRAAARRAQGVVDGLAKDPETVGLVVIALRRVVGVGGEVVTRLREAG